MDSSDSECTPPEIVEAAKNTSLKLLPPKFRDAIYIYGNITNAQCGYTMIKRDEWNHSDFIWAKDMVELMVKPVLEKISQFEKGICKNF